MEALYQQTKRLVHDIHDSFVHLERLSGSDAHRVENDIQARIDNITSNCERLDIFVNKEPPTRRSGAKYKVDQLKYDCQHLQAALRNLQHKRYSREQEQQDREDLLAQSFRPNERETTIAIDQALQANSSLHSSHHMLDDLFSSGSGILANLRDQRQTLKGAHKRILDVANTLGLSNTVMRLIERRSVQDKFILIGGILFTCIVMFLVVKYLT